MKERLRQALAKGAAWFEERLTVAERWTVFGVLAVVLLGAFVKYWRLRPAAGAEPETPAAQGASEP